MAMVRQSTDETRSMLLLIFSKDAPFEKVSGMKGVVRLLLDFTSLDSKWRDLKLKLRVALRGTRTFVEDVAWYLREPFPDGFFETRIHLALDHFLKRIKEYPNVTPREKDMVSTIIKLVKHGHALGFQHENVYFATMLPRLFDAFKTKQFHGDFLTQEVFRCQAALCGEGRFAKKEVAEMYNFASLNAEGIEFTGIREDFKQCTVVLRTSRGERVQVEVILPDDYPFKAPSFRFVGESRPRIFAAFQTIRTDLHFEWAMNTLDGSLRSILLEMETQGVVLAS
jgi:hypothetical protein